MADTTGKVASGQESTRLADEFVQALEREAAMMARAEGMPERGGVAFCLLDAGLVMIKQALREADAFPSVAPSHPMFETELAVRQALKIEVREACELLLAESQV